MRILTDDVEASCNGRSAWHFTLLKPRGGKKILWPREFLLRDARWCYINTAQRMLLLSVSSRFEDGNRFCWDRHHIGNIEGGTTDAFLSKSADSHCLGGYVGATHALPFLFAEEILISYGDTASTKKTSQSGFQRFLDLGLRSWDWLVMSPTKKEHSQHIPNTRQRIEFRNSH